MKAFSRQWFPVLMTGEIKDWSAEVPIGEVHNFEWYGECARLGLNEYRVLFDFKIKIPQNLFLYDIFNFT